MHKYRSQDDCSQRLRNSVIVHQGRPMYITNTLSASKLKATDLITRVDSVIELEASSVAPPRLGYVNMGQRVHYVYRRPVRRVRQGLCVENLSCGSIEIAGLITSVEFGRMLINEYPSLDTATKAILQGYNSIAFSRMFALKNRNANTAYLLYAGNTVGTFDLKTREFKIEEAFSCLKEVLNASS